MEQKNGQSNLFATQEEREMIDLSEIFPIGEHAIYAYYGRIGQGKTYAMTADVIDALKAGQVVYVNYPIDWDGFDERESILYLILHAFGRKLYKFPKENLRRIEIDETFLDTFEKLTDCIVALDEGYVVFDSYEMAKMSLKKRKAVLFTRHFDRSIWYTTQRPTGVHVTMRGNTSVFYKVTKVFSLFGRFVLFRRDELDLDPKGETPDEKNVFSKKYYWGRPSIFRAYNTKYLRYGAEASQMQLGWQYHLTYKQIIQKVFSRLSEKKLFHRIGKVSKETS